LPRSRKHLQHHQQSAISSGEEEEKYNLSSAAIQTLSHLRFSARYRRPATMVPRVARSSLSLSSTAANSSTTTNYLPTIKPPYNNNSLDRFEDCFRSDKLVQNGIVKRTELVIGQHGKIVMDTTEEFDDPNDRQDALEKISNNQQYQDARKTIQQLLIKPAINFHTNLKAAVIQSKVYGRSAIEMVGSDEQGLPDALHVLNSKRLAQVEIDPLSWQLLGVHYLDLNKGSTGMEDVLPVESLIYFANRDYHVSPGSLYYGLSELEGIVDGSDSKRIAKQEDIKEIMKSNWAPFLIMKFINPNITVQQMQEVVNGISPGLPFAHKQDIETQTVNLQSDLQKLTDAVDFLNRESLRELGVPGFIAGYEQIANYANSQQTLLAYKEIELEADRTWVSDIVEQQWLNKLFYQLLNIDPDIDNPEVKLKYEFGDISFETDLDKTNAALLLYDRQLISGEAVLKIAGHDDLLEEYKLIQQQKEQNRQIMLQQMQIQQQQQQQDQPDQQQQQPGQQNDRGIRNTNVDSKLQNQPANQTESQRLKNVSTTSRKRQASIEDLYQKFSDTLDSIAQT
jgi:hypothetical protein